MKEIIITVVAKYHRCCLFLSIILISFSSFANSKNDFQFFTLGTGGITGVYYSAGNAICQLINRQFSQYKMRCAVESTAGSAFNLQSVRDKKFMFGLVQANIHYQALVGEKTFAEEKPYTNLRSVFSLHEDAFTIMARADEGIDKLADLKGRRVDLGAINSGTRINAKELLRVADLLDSDFSSLTSLKPDQTTQALCAKDIDAYIFLVGHPARNTEESIRRCNAKILQLGSRTLSELSKIPYFSKTTIPAGLYKNNPDAIETYSVRVTLVTDNSTPDIVVYHLVKSVMENLEQFKKRHPALSALSPESMVSEGLTAPLHAGAKQYYKERGFL